jgi:serine/threonine protein kinase
MTVVEEALPSYYQPRSRLYIQLPEHDNILKVQVIKAFAPFTMAQVILVKRVGKGRVSKTLQLPRTFILKIYDPRFYSHRLPEGSRPARPWNFDAEKLAADIRAEQSRTRDPDFEPGIMPEGEDDKAAWEEWYYQNAEMQHFSEQSAYDRLKDLQGSSIPLCYGSASLRLTERGRKGARRKKKAFAKLLALFRLRRKKLFQVCDRAISPHVLILEHIPNSVPLDKVDPGVVSTQLTQSLLDTAAAFSRLGVVHTDLNTGNILFSPGDRPTRAVVIDFGESIVREEEDDQTWAEIVDENADVAYMRKRLKRFIGTEPGELGDST